MPHWRLLSAPLLSVSIPHCHCKHSSSLVPGALQLLLPPHAASTQGTPGAETKLINWASFGWMCQTTVLSAPETEGWDTWAALRRANRGEFISLGYASPLISPSEACLICFDEICTAHFFTCCWGYLCYWITTSQRSSQWKRSSQKTVESTYKQECILSSLGLKPLGNRPETIKTPCINTDTNVLE